MQVSMTDREDFLRYLALCKTEQQLFSRLTFAILFRQTDADARCDLLEDVKGAAYEMRLPSVEYKVSQWLNQCKDAWQADPDAFLQQASAEPAALQAKPKLPQAFSAQQLSDMPVPPIRYIVEGMLPMGMGVLVAKPKLGKSWMVLDLCLSVAAGTPFLGMATHPHGTLYLALEDSKARMKSRLLKVLDGQPAPENMHVMFEAPRMDEGLLDEVGRYLDEHPDIHLVCIDTLSKIKPRAKPYENAYDADYAYMGKLKAFADSRGICVLLVHHTRKSRNPEDSFDNINGSTGILGASDFTIVLDKHSRMDDEAVFTLTGRDVEQCELVLRFDKARCRWALQGSAAEVAARQKVQAYESDPIVLTLRSLLLQGDGSWQGSARSLQEMGRRYAHTELAPTSQALTKAITALEPLLWERDAVKHWVRRYGTSGITHVFKMGRIDQPPASEKAMQCTLRM